MIPLLVWGNHRISDKGFQDTFRELVNKQQRFNIPIFIINRPPVLKPLSSREFIRQALYSRPSVQVFVYGDREIRRDPTLKYAKERFLEIINIYLSRPKSVIVICVPIPNDAYDLTYQELFGQFNHWLKATVKNYSRVIPVSVNKRLNSRCYDSFTHLKLKGQQRLAQSLAKALFCIPKTILGCPKNLKR